MYHLLVLLFALVSVSAFHGVSTRTNSRMAVSMGFLDNVPVYPVWPGGPSIFGGSGSPAPKPAPTPAATKSNKKAAASATPKKKKDMTWGGRPDPTPEAYVEDKGGFLGSGWRLSKKKKA